MSDAKEGAEWLAEAVKTGSKIWADVPDNFVNELRGVEMRDFEVKTQFYGSVKIKASSIGEAAIDQVKKHIDTIKPVSGGHVVIVDGEKYGVTVIVSINYEVRKL